jgi:hemerythrin
MKEMAKTWTEDLSVGVKEIDNQHKDFIAALNSLLDSMARGKGRENIGDQLYFIEGYVDKHFKMEEEYMRRFMYPKYHAHKAIHDGFKKEMADIKSEFETKGPQIKLVIRIEKNMLDWLINHIHEVDKKLGAFLAGKV